MKRRSILADPLELEWLRTRVSRGLFGGDELLLVGRFEVRGKLGTGAMGTVWAAHDPELTRDVAIKMLLGGGDDARLRREAQAMARLRHPNVVAVHELGTWRETAFVAMERVEGPTLRVWLAEQRRTVDEVLAVYLGAGQGLAAAHTAGLVHRDFKPDNILVDAAGIARVADFGLSREDDTRLVAIDRARAAKLALAETATATAGRVGTPAYMAPEQLRGEPATARSDQYSFAASLHEALHGRRLFDEAATGDAATGVISPRVRRAIERALVADPDARHPTMTALLRELAPPARHTGWWVAAGLALVAAASVAWIATRPDAGPRVDLCGGGPVELAGAWNPTRADAVRAALAASGRPYAATAATGTIELLDAYARRWLVMHRQSCEASRVHRSQPDDMLALRSACLSDRRRVLGALASRLTHADGELAERAVRAAGDLPSLESCEDLGALRRRQPPPADPAIAAKLAAMDDPIADARAAYLAGHYDEALAAARALAATAEPLGYAPRTAEILTLAGQSASSAGQSAEANTVLERAYSEALAAGDDVGAATVATTLAYNIGYLEEKVDEGRRWTRFASGHLRGLGDDPAVAARLANVEADIAQVAGAYEEARAGFVRAQAAWRAASGDRTVDLAGAILNEGNALHRLGRDTEAIDRLTIAQATWIERLGADHPLVSTSHISMTNALRTLGRFDGAIEHATRALDITRNNLGSDHPDLGRALGTLGNVYLEAGKPGEALARFEEADRIFVARLGPDHPLVASTFTNRGLAELELRRFDVAEQHLRDGLAGKAAQRGEQHPSLMTSLEALGDLEMYRGRPRAAIPHYERARTIGLAAFGLDTDQISFALVGLGRAHLALRDPRRALAALDRAVALRSRPDGATPAELGYARYYAGRARWDLGDRAAGREQIDLALTVLATAGPTYAEVIREHAAWRTGTIR